MNVYLNNRLCYLIEEFLLVVRLKAAALTLTSGHTRTPSICPIWFLINLRFDKWFSELLFKCGVFSLHLPAILMCPRVHTGVFR